MTDKLHQKKEPSGYMTLYNVVTVNVQRHDVALTLIRRCFKVACPLGRAISAFLESFWPLMRTTKHMFYEEKKKKQDYSRCRFYLEVCKLWHFHHIIWVMRMIVVIKYIETTLMQ